MPNYERLTRGAPAGVSKDDYARFLVCVSTSEELSDQFVAVLGRGVNPRVLFSPEHIAHVIRELGPKALQDERSWSASADLGR